MRKFHLYIRPSKRWTAIIGKEVIQLLQHTIKSYVSEGSQSWLNLGEYWYGRAMVGCIIIQTRVHESLFGTSLRIDSELLGGCTQFISLDGAFFFLLSSPILHRDPLPSSQKNSSMPVSELTMFALLSPFILCFLVLSTTPLPEKFLVILLWESEVPRRHWELWVFPAAENLDLFLVDKWQARVPMTRMWVCRQGGLGIPPGL